MTNRNFHDGEVADWVRRAQDGDEEAFGALVKMYHERIYHAAYAIAGCAEDAREIEQLAWIKAWRRLHEFRYRSQFYTWLYRIAVNTAKDWLRSRARQRSDPMPESGPEAMAVALMERPASVAARPDREAHRADLRELFARALQQLSPEHRLAITLREIEGLSYEEIAKIMKCRTGTVMSRLFYARRSLQQWLRSYL